MARGWWDSRRWRERYLRPNKAQKTKYLWIIIYFDIPQDTPHINVFRNNDSAPELQSLQFSPENGVACEHIILLHIIRR